MDVTKQTAGRSEAERGGAKHGEAVARRCTTTDEASKGKPQQPRPSGRNTFITTSYAPRPGWPVTRYILTLTSPHVKAQKGSTR